jgi:hypothetical protein
MERFIVLYQEWEESERGWGVRPDGYSLHIDAEHHKTYVEKFMKDQHKFFTSSGMSEDAVPDEYSRPSGSPIHVNVSAEVHAQLTARGGDYMGSNFDGIKIDAAHNLVGAPKGLTESPEQPKPAA